MAECMSLHDYAWTDFPGVVADVLSGKAKLFALINASHSDWFTPEDDEDNWRRAESGRYECYGPSQDAIISALEEIHAAEMHPDSIRIGGGPHKVELSWLQSPKGDRGVLGKCFGDFAEAWHVLEPLKIPFTRIFVEQSMPRQRTDDYQVKTPEFLAVLEVWEKYWADGKPGMTKDAIVAELVDQGFSPVSAAAIDRVCRPEHAREGRRKQTK